jgi:hypothetical protein
MSSLQERAIKEQRTFKEVTNEVLALGLNRHAGTGEPWYCPTHKLGSGRFSYEKAWEAIDRLEADAVAEKIDLRK